MLLSSVINSECAIVFVFLIEQSSSISYECSCQCPLGSDLRFAYTNEYSTDACIQACISIPFNRCLSSNTYACLEQDCAYSSSYKHTKAIRITRAKPRRPPNKGRNRVQKCRCTIRYASQSIMNQCPDRVYGTSTTGDIGACQNDAKNTAPQQCRQYYGHCSFLPN